MKYLKKGQTRGETGTYPESNQALVDIRHGMCEQQHIFPFDVIISGPWAVHTIFKVKVNFIYIAHLK